jgi:hypothetical protein
MHFLASERSSTHHTTEKRSPENLHAEWSRHPSNSTSFFLKSKVSAANENFPPL